jgi:hypothetical protein
MRPSSDRTARGRVRYPDPVPSDSFEEHAWAVHVDLLDMSEAALHRELGLARLRSAACRRRRSTEADGHRRSDGIATSTEWCSRGVSQCRRDCHSIGVTGDNTRRHRLRPRQSAAPAGPAGRHPEWPPTSPPQCLFKTGGRLIRHARYFIRQPAEIHLTPTVFRQILGRVERLASHPT